MYKSRFSLINVYAVFLPAALLFGLGYYCIAYSETLRPAADNGNKQPLPVGVFFICATAWILFRTAKKAAVVRVDEATLAARSFLKKYDLTAKDISSVELFARMTQGAFGSAKLFDGINIILKDGTAVFLFDNYYRDGAALRQAIKVFAEKNKPGIAIIIPQKTDPGNSATFNADAESFGEKFWLREPGIVLVLSMAFPVVMLKAFLVSQIPVVRGWMIIYPLLVVISYSFRSNYFIIESNTLTVRNHLRFWKKENYAMEDIEGAFFVKQYRQANALRIIRADCSYKNIYAGGLINKDWQRLQNRLNDSGIAVRSDFSLSSNRPVN